MKSKIYCGFLPLLVIFNVCANEKMPLPTTEQFQSLLSACAAGAGIEIDGELRGSISEIYDGVRSTTEGRIKVLTATEFLKVLPPEDRLEGFKLYNTCLLDILNGEKKEIQSIPEVYEIPNQLVTFGKPLHIKAKTIIANSSEIRSFPVGSTASLGTPGSRGNNGANGENGSGGAATHGSNGSNGTNGSYGSNGGEIRIEAEQLIGKLRIINNGIPGGAGGSGGHGGNGGTGGKGKNSINGIIDCSSGPGNGGTGGNAGNGGVGGRGGNGGNGGSVIIDIQKVEQGSSINISSLGSLGGAAGAEGRAGNLGKGGPRGNTGGHCGGGGRGPGADGAPGNNGGSLGQGQNGIDGQIEVTIGNKTSVSSGTYSKTF